MRVVRRIPLLTALLALAVNGCDGPLPPHHPKPLPTTPILPSSASAPTAVPVVVPDSAPFRDIALVKPTWQTLNNAFTVGTLSQPGLPLVHLRWTILSGISHDDDRPGVSMMTARLMKEGGAGGLSGQKLAEQVELLGSSLDVSVTHDRTVFSMTVTRELLGDAIRSMATVIQSPNLAAADQTSLKKRMVTEAQNLARENAPWVGSVMLHKKLFVSPQNPYYYFDTPADELQKLTVGDCKTFYQKQYVAKNMFLVAAGDVSHDEVVTLLNAELKTIRVAEPQKPLKTAGIAPAIQSFTVIDRPKSTQSNVYIGALGPPRSSVEWPAWITANHLLGGTSGRLYSTVREKAALTYSVGSQVAEFAQGPSIAVVHAATEPVKTALTVRAILQEFDKLQTEPPTAANVSNSVRFLSDNTAIRLETVAALAGELTKNHVLGLPDDTPNLLRRSLQNVTHDQVVKVAALYFRPAVAQVVVVGDASLVAPLLSSLGTVLVVDPQASFAIKETLQAAPEPSASPSSEPQK